MRHSERSATLVGQLRSFLQVPDNVLAIVQNRDILHRLDAAFFRVGEAQNGLLIKFYGGEEHSEEELRAKDEVYLKIEGRTHYLWRAVDQEGVVPDILVQSRRNKQAAIRFLGRLLARMQYVPRVVVTDKLKSYGAAIKELKLEVDHRQHKEGPQ